MSYQRPDKNRYYVWMGHDGLHIMHKSLVDNVIFEHDSHGKANAKAVLNGLVDFLASEGVEVSVRKGKVKYT